jgi:hypothetical protein
MNESEQTFSHANEATATLTVDSDVILPWREVADVLGIPVDQFLDRLLGRLKPASRLLALSDRFRGIVFAAVKTSRKTNSPIPTWAETKVIETWNATP